MLNYDNLNDIEFEALCNDIMSRKLGIPLRRFGPGRDGGVDLTDDAAKKYIVVQVKHYRSSTPEQLIRSLKKELPKVQQLDPQQYYICCSRKLSAENISELYQHFGAYMESSWNVVTLTEIDDLLHQDAYRDILKRHFKLWLDDVGILEDIFGNELFVDCDVLLDDIEQQKKFFVQTKAFDQALNVLENHQVLCIVGNPGVGKSITSKMLVLHYAALGYQVRYTSDVTDLGSLKRSISKDPNKREIILLDDCFGQAYFEMRSKQSTASLVELIKYVKRRSSKVLILNSRVTIFHEAQQRQQKLAQSLDRDDFKIFLLDINNLSDVEKAKIFYNHLSFSGIPDEYLADIRKERRYRTIVSHRNYNPRIIEFVCSPRRYSDVDPQNFYNFILKHLNNPNEMWADEYENRLDSVDRILLQTIYSLTTTTVGFDLVRQCFEHRISRIQNIDKTLDLFTMSIQRLNRGFIRIIDHGGKKEVATANPSVNDFLDCRLSPNTLERQELLRSICAVNQFRLIPSEEFLSYTANLLRTQAIDNFIFQDTSEKNVFIGSCIICSTLQLKQYQPAFWEYIKLFRYIQPLFNCPLPSQTVLMDRLLLPEIWDFYELKSFFEQKNHLYELLSKWSIDDSFTFISKCDALFQGSNRILYIEQVNHYLQDAIADLCEVEAAWYDIDVREAVIDTSVSSFDGEEEFPDTERAAEYINNIAAENALDDLYEHFHKLPPHFFHLISKINAGHISVLGADSLVENFLSGEDYDLSDYYQREEDQETSDFTPIDAIFER